jgi:hypothetical protein
VLRGAVARAIAPRWSGKAKIKKERKTKEKRRKKQK